MKIYTKTGDDGTTGMLGGRQVSKSHLAIETVGTIDELNSILGIVGSEPFGRSLADLIANIQNQLFDLGSRVSACLSETDRVAEFGQERIGYLESTIDDYDQRLPDLTEFILPRGCPAGCQLHLARSVCRRAERRLVELIQSERELKREFGTELIYLNRLSDLLFVLARSVNQDAGVPENKWEVAGGRGNG